MSGCLYLVLIYPEEVQEEFFDLSFAVISCFICLFLFEVKRILKSTHTTDTYILNPLWVWVKTPTLFDLMTYVNDVCFCSMVMYADLVV